MSVVTQLDSPIGPLFVVAADDGIRLLEFADRPAIASQAESVRAWFGDDIAPGSNRHIDRLARELERYFRGTLTTFSVPLAIAGTPFQRRVWDVLRSIPCGSTRTYGSIARELRCAKSPRAVGRANGLNRLAILIPCHRVVRRDGSLCGYGGGLWRKRYLLELERDAIVRSASRARSSRVEFDTTPLK